MNIGIDITALEEGPVTGVERALEALLYYFPKIDEENSFLLLCRRKPALQFPLQSNMRVEIIESSLPLSLWRETFLDKLEKSAKLSAFYSPYLAFPLRGGFQKVVTFHDPPWLFGGEKGRRKENIIHRLRLLLAVRFAGRILSVSEWSKRAILDLYPESSRKITVTHLGVGHPFPVIGSGEDLTLYGLPPGPFLLTVGTLRERKNLSFALQVYKAFRSKGGDLPFIVCGKDGGEARRLKREASEMNLKESVYFPGYLPDKVLSALYEEASFLLFPSLQEGFGLPALEAMCRSTPVIASSKGALPEIVADSGIVMEGFNPEQWAETILSLMSDDEKRGELVDRGKARAARFTWESYARKVHEAILPEVEESTEESKLH